VIPLSRIAHERDGVAGPEANHWNPVLKPRQRGFHYRTGSGLRQRSWSPCMSLS
jgi:hypothetical protein